MTHAKYIRTHAEHLRALKEGAETPTALLGRGQRKPRALAPLTYTHYGLQFYDGSTVRNTNRKTGLPC